MSSLMDGVNRLTNLVGQNRMELLLFRLGGRQRFGINVFKVREVIACPELTSIPHSHPVIRGIANMRGQTITVMDIAQAIGRRPIDLSASPDVIITEYNRMVQGFLVSGVERIVNTNWEEIKPPPRGLGRVNYLTAVTSIDGELVEIIDVERVLSDVMGIDQEMSEEIREEGESVAGRLVVVVDDSLVALKQVCGVLDQLGVRYETARNGEEALNLLRKLAESAQGRITGTVSLVLSDIEMPKMDGYTLTRNIKEDPALKDLYVCLHSSLSGVFNQGMVERVGADRLLTKFDPDELGQAVIEILKTTAAREAA